jgi:hypothetical protein
MHLVLLKLGLVLRLDLQELQVLLQHFAQLVVMVLAVQVQKTQLAQQVLALEQLAQRVLQPELAQRVQEFLA